MSITPNDKPLVVLGSVFTQKEILRLSTSIRALPAQRFAKVISNRSSIVFVAMPNDYRETFRRSRCFFVVKVFFFPIPHKKAPQGVPGSAFDGVVVGVAYWSPLNNTQAIHALTRENPSQINSSNLVTSSPLPPQIHSRLSLQVLFQPSRSLYPCRQGNANHFRHRQGRENLSKF